MYTSTPLYAPCPDLTDPTRTIFLIVAKALSQKSNLAAETLGARIRRLRTTRGLTQTELGQALGLSQRMMAHYESQGGRPSPPLLASLAKALRVSVDELVGIKGNTAQHDMPTSASELRLWRRFRLVEQLSPADRRSIIRQIEALARQAGIKIDDDQAA
jgi:transcriptional regulator with XRE-family HTH domain